MKTAHPASFVKDSLVVQSCNKIFSNTLIDMKMSERDNRIRQCTEEHFLKQLKIEKVFALIRDLKVWVHESQKEEILPNLVKDLVTMTRDEQKIYLNYLRKPKIIRTTGKRQMDLPVTIHTLDTLESLNVKALLDSGCTGSCINSKFIKRNNINTKTLQERYQYTMQTGRSMLGDH